MKLPCIYPVSREKEGEGGEDGSKRTERRGAPRREASCVHWLDADINNNLITGFDTAHSGFIIFFFIFPELLYCYCPPSEIIYSDLFHQFSLKQKRSQTALS